MSSPSSRDPDGATPGPEPLDEAVGSAVVAAPVTAALVTVLVADAAAVAARLAAGAGGRAERTAARQALQRAFVAEGSDDHERLLAAVRDLAWWLSALGDAGVAAVRPLHAVWIRRPFPDRVLFPVVARRLAAHGRVVWQRCTPQLAFTEERLAWFEARCKAEAPGVVRPVRASTQERENLAGSEFELLRKRGKSPFS